MPHKLTASENDELSLGELGNIFTAVRSTFKKVAQALVKAVRKYLIPLLVLLITVMLYNFYQYRRQIPVYSSRASFVYNELHKKTYGEMTDIINDLFQSGSYGTAALLLNTDKDLISGITEMKAVNIYGSKLSEDMTTDRSPFYIIVTSKERKVFDSLDAIIERYFNNNGYAASKRERKINSLRKEIVYGRLELAKLDSLKSSLPEILKAGGNKEGMAIDIVGLYEQSINLYKDIVNKEDVMDNLKPVEVLNGFVSSEHPDRHHISYYMLKAAIMFLLCGIILVLLILLFSK